MISIAYHLGRFEEALASIEGQQQEFHAASSLLRYASCIDGVSYSAASEAGMYCSGVAEFERKEEAALTPYLKQQTVFSIAWMALENYIDEAGIQYSPSKGKITGLCEFLLLQRSSFDIPQFYSQIVDDWSNIEPTLNGFSPRRFIPDHLREVGDGILRVYKLRNHLFHGSFTGFMPGEEAWLRYCSALGLGIRIIGLTLQMGLVASLAKYEDMETYWHPDLNDESEIVSLRYGLSVLHLEKNEQNKWV